MTYRSNLEYQRRKERVNMLSVLIDWVGNRQLPLRAKNIRVIEKAIKEIFYVLRGVITCNNITFVAPKYHLSEKRNFDWLFRLSVKIKFNEMWTAAELFSSKAVLCKY